MGLLETELTINSNGLIPSMLIYLFNAIRKLSNKNKYKITMSFIQIYMENIQDLFITPKIEEKEEFDNNIKKVKTKNNINIREDKEKGFYLENIKEFPVENIDEALELLTWGLKNRIIKSTMMNTQSSRSHTILSVNLTQVYKYNNNNI